MADLNVWNSLPEAKSIHFALGEHSDSEEDYPDWERTSPYNIYKRSADFEWDGIHFQVVQEWFFAPQNPSLCVFREIIEPDRNCDFFIINKIEDPKDPEWKVSQYLDQENNSCGILMQDSSGRKGLICETSQIMSISMKVDETRKDCTRSYQVTAFEESPVKLEKYISFHTEDEGNDFQETAWKECRDAAKMRFDNLRGR